MEVRCMRKPWTDGIEVAIFTKSGNRVSVAQPLVLKDLEPGGVVCEPTFSLSNQSAQDLIDELWRCGLRPSEGAGSAGSLAATERHLKDMQAVAMGLLRKEGVQL